MIPEIIELIEENVGSKLCDIILGGDFLNLTPKTMATKVQVSETAST